MIERSKVQGVEKEDVIWAHTLTHGGWTDIRLFPLLAWCRLACAVQMNGYFKSESGKSRAEPGSTRWIYNKFLRRQTKLRWVCGLCNVWCKDENGFKCHLEHENHIRKSEIARQSGAPEFKMSSRDEAFAASFVQYLAQNYLNRKVLLHEVYREMYPDDKFQRLMHDTCWGSLGTFINALSKAGECEAVKGPKGWIVRIDQEMLIAAEAEKEAREKALREAETEGDDQKNQSKKEGTKKDPNDEDDEDLEASCYLAQANAETPAVPDSRSKRMQASWASTLSQPAPKKRKDDGGAKRAAALAREAQKETPTQSAPEPEEPTDMTNRGKVTFQLSTQSTAKRQAQPEKQKALWPKGLVVKVLCPDTLQGKALGLKAVTLESEGGSVHLQLLKPVAGDTKVLVKNELLETVLPKLGNRVLVLGSPSMEGTLESVQTESFSCTVQTESGSLSGLPYDRVCKIWTGWLRTFEQTSILQACHEKDELVAPLNLRSLFLQIIFAEKRLLSFLRPEFWILRNRMLVVRRGCLIICSSHSYLRPKASRPRTVLGLMGCWGRILVCCWLALIGLLPGFLHNTYILRLPTRSWFMCSQLRAIQGPARPIGVKALGKTFSKRFFRRNKYVEIYVSNSIGKKWQLTLSGTFPRIHAPSAWLQVILQQFWISFLSESPLSQQSGPLAQGAHTPTPIWSPCGFVDRGWSACSRKRPMCQSLQMEFLLLRFSPCRNPGCLKPGLLGTQKVNA